MASCERCWADAQSFNDPAEAYDMLIKKRECTPEEQAGRGASQCPQCGRYAIHIHVSVCMACGFEKKATLKFVGEKWVKKEAEEVSDGEKDEASGGDA